jgi:predicted nucleotidyltransferase
MTASEISSYLIEQCEALKNYKAYMFGSTLNGVGHDIDILIVGPAGDSLLALKKEIIFAGRELPLDVIYMQPSEAIETDFVRREGCVELSVLAISCRSSVFG